MGTRRVLCKFFVHGACLKGEHCEFSHDWKDQANNVCTFYQKGACSYGSRCRYDHVKLHRPASSAPATLPHSYAASSTIHATVPSEMHLNGSSESTSANTNLSAQSQPFVQLSTPAWDENHEPYTFQDTEISQSASLDPADRPICSFAAAGSCPRGEKCPHMHGDLCSTCGKHCLHPYRPEEREEHKKLCEKNNKYLESLKLSQEIECSVCLERVLLKPKIAERKFGLLSECDHAFCISCIRNWRSSSAPGVDVTAALRACPICRKLSYFVIPSVIWYSTMEEKLEIVENYKAKLKSIDCRYFDFGNGKCPFGTSCFYKHAYRDGRLEEVVLRHLSSEDGNTVIARDAFSVFQWLAFLIEVLINCLLGEKFYCVSQRNVQDFLKRASRWCYGFNPYP